ncbi:hypothetical protein [Aurantiacibacter rhizosphaerae]|uniref:Aspartate-semialdehyde dehydrogenase n=1 Tax=Aurantiacibacter rhizosphaerae TaxID=2691582 RepID=A0A844XF86_9SPHN|nr:hypothetical protein [Aurantiacibacter rhizosphaerae]MWV28264.1 hypothetical protein [Aurantiacibacter rhizosphaerae]
MRRLALIALPLMLAACGDAPDGSADDITAADDGAMGEDNPMADATLELQGTGIVIPAQSGFEELAVPFGSARAPTEATLGNVLGRAVDETDTPNDCGLTYTAYEGLSLNFRDGQFVGYWAEPPYVPETTRAAMLADENIRMVEDSTVGPEFVMGAEEVPDIGGLFTGEGDDASVQALWAGENCIAR